MTNVEKTPPSQTIAYNNVDNLLKNGEHISLFVM